MRFTKMHGAGNDFVVLDAVEQPLGIAPEDLPGLVSRLCDRHTGVGADGVMVRNIVLFGVLIYELVGPALTGLYDTILRALRDEPGFWWHTYKRVWKQSFKSSFLPGMIFTGLWVPNLLAMMAVYAPVEKSLHLEAKIHDVQNR